MDYPNAIRSVAAIALYVFLLSLTNFIRAGRLIAKVKPTQHSEIRRTALSLVGLLLTLSFVGWIRTLRLGASSLSDDLFIMPVIVSVILYNGIAPRLCDKGIYWYGTFMPWNRIQSVTWKPGNKVLLSSRDGQHWWSPPSIEFLVADKEKISKLLDQKLPTFE